MRKLASFALLFAAAAPAVTGAVAYAPLQPAERSGDIAYSPLVREIRAVPAPAHDPYESIAAEQDVHPLVLKIFGGLPESQESLYFAKKVGEYVNRYVVLHLVRYGELYLDAYRGIAEGAAAERADAAIARSDMRAAYDELVMKRGMSDPAYFNDWRADGEMGSSADKSSFKDRATAEVELLKLLEEATGEAGAAQAEK